VLAYLEACGLLFEQGFLSHGWVGSLDAKNIDKGYQYFTEWIYRIIDKGMEKAVL